MKIKVFYNGNPAHTKIVDQETNEMVEGVVAAHVDLDAFEARATLIFTDFEAELTNVEVVQDEDTQGLYRGTGNSDNTDDIDETSQQV